MHASPLTIAVGCFAAGSLAAVGIANAVSAPQKIPDSTTGVITSCVSKKGGAVRFVDAQKGKKCKKSERKVTFNQTGPQGDQGAQGIQGTQGERGPSNAFVKTRTTTKTLTELPLFPVTNDVVSLSLDAGKYVISAHTVARATNGSTVSITCSITGPTDTVTGTTSRFNVAQDIDTTFAINATYNNAAAGTIDLSCVPRDAVPLGFNGDGQASSATITATKVTDLTVQ